MKFIYPYSFPPHSNLGGHIHVNQFINNIESMGHEVITRRGDPERSDPGLDHGAWDRFNKVRKSDVVYYRIEEKAPHDRLYSDIVRKIIHHPLIVWEFNAIPEYSLLSGASTEDIDREKNLFTSLAKYCDLAICVSKELEQYVNEEFGIENTCFVANGSDPDWFRSDIEPVNRINRSPDILNVVWIGSAGIGWHDFDLMKDAAADICQLGYESNIIFHVIGGDMPSMSDMPANVLYHGSERYEDLPQWLAAMDVGLVLYKEGPAKYNSPLKLFDYMASGLAVVGTIQPQLRDIFSEMECEELLIPVGDQNKLVEKLVWLLENNDKLLTYGNNARRLLVEKYTWKHNASKIVHEINKIRNLTSDD